MEKRKWKPLVYRVTFLLDGYPDRKPSVVVVASDAAEAIETAAKFVNDEHGSCRFQSAEKLKPRWVDTDTDAPDVLSPSAMEYYQSGTK